MDNNTIIEKDSYKKSKRIASNTLLLFIRMFFITIINLYTVRIVLKGLGEEDYGIFNTVAGVVTTSAFVSSVLALSIQRFYSMALGKQNAKELNEIFSASVNIIIILSIIILLIFETVGLWFLQTQLTIPASRMVATGWIYQFALFAFIFSIIQIPFTAIIFAHEDMGIYALISTIDCLLKLVVAFLIGKAQIDNLIFYGAGLSLTAIIVMVMYITIGHLKYKECVYKRTKTIPLYKKLLSFSGWTMFGSVASVGMIQGSTILINIFFGPLVNVAFGIALQINNAFSSLCNNIILPFRPAMIRAYAEKNFGYLYQLFSVGNKFTLYILIAVALPFIFEMNTILRLWLGNTNSNIVIFSRLTIIYIVCLTMNNPITIMMQASGHIKEYHLPVESITLMCLPLNWFLFHLGFPSYSVFYSMISVCLIAHIVRLLCLRHFFNGFSINQYITKLILPAIVITIIGLFFTFLLHHYVDSAIWRLITVVILSPTLTFILAYYLGINRQERMLIKTFVKSTIKNRL